MATLIEDLKMFTPKNDEEAADYTLLLEAAHREEAYNRAWPAHFTASAWVVNPLRTKTLMIYHNIYQSWSWIGGHADGIHDLSLVAAKELEEETGLSSAKMAHSGLLSCETLTVDGHWKRGAYVPSDLHLNTLRIAPEENSGVRWLTFDEALTASTEPWMVEHVYRKLIERSK